MSVTYVTSGLLDHLPQLGREISGGVIKNNPTSKQPYPPDSHMGSWVGWVETGRMLSFLQVHKDQRQREGVFQSCKICGKSLKEAKIESSESLFFRGETYWRRVSQFVSLLIVITFTDGSVPVVLLGHKANVPAA